MLPTSHIAPIQSLGANSREALLARFDDFIQSAGRLEHSHRELHDEVSRLRQELEERNRQLEKSLRDIVSTRQLLSRVLETLPCGIVVLETNSQKPILANREAERLLWREGDRGVELPAALKQLLKRIVVGSRDSSHEEEFCPDSTEAGRWLSVRAAQVALLNSTSLNHILIIQDISAQKGLEASREQTRNAVALAETSSVLAHEIRNPLCAMELFLNLLCSQGALNEKAQKWTAHLTAGVRTLSALVNNVLQFYTSGTLTMEWFDPYPLLQECTEFVDPVAKQASIDIRIDYQISGLQVRGDLQALRQVILNLCVNSIRHSAPGKMVTISVRLQSAGTLRIEVADQGTGIPREHLPYIFQAGYSATGRSSGLGLALCKRIIQAHGGEIGVLRTDSTGTTMYVELPTA